MRVLVVDDDAAVRDSLARTLRFEGHEVEVAADQSGNDDPPVIHAMSPRVGERGTTEQSAAWLRAQRS